MSNEKPGSYWGTWGRVGVPKLENGLSRRELLWLALTAAGSYAVGALMTTGLLTVAEGLVSPVLSEEEWDRLYSLAQANHRSLIHGVAPDFERQGLSAVWDGAQSARESIPETRFVSVFSNLEDIFRPERMALLSQNIREIHAHGFVPMLGLGPGWADPHPFHESKDEIIKTMIGDWIRYLGSFGFPIHVRWLFENNMINGDIAHKPHWNYGGQWHIDRYKHLMEYFDRRRSEHRGRIFLHAAFAAAGYDPLLYLLGLDCALDGVGIDVYPDIHGKRLVHQALAAVLGWETYSPLPNAMLSDLAAEAARRDTGLFVYEYSPRHDVIWMEQLLLALYALGGSGDISFGIDKSVSEGINWQISHEAMLVRATLADRLRRESGPALARS